MPRILSSKRFLKNKRTAALFLIFIIVFFVFLYFGNMYVSVRKIEVSSPEGTIRIVGIENFYFKNIFLLFDGQIERIIYENNSQVKRVRVAKKYPDTLHLFIEFDRPIVALEVDQGYFLLTGEGRIIAKRKKTSLKTPVMKYYQKLHYTAYQAGDTLKLKDLLLALHFTKQASDLGFSASGIDINGLDMIRLQVDKKVIFFTTEKDRETQDYQLERLVRQFKIEGKDFKTLDLRFDKPIVTLQ
ncbi:hypothetical protein HYT33_00775 [Candidatus Roizmanbacteria bacterium]|nr:hypothetical protein [Candidatus Roizmanbacteria bacterium]